MSTIVVVIGPHITAGSSLINLAKNGNEQPTNLEIIIVMNNVIATKPAIIAILAVPSNLGNWDISEEVSTIPTAISNINHPNENNETINPIIAETRNSFQTTLP